MPLKYCKHLGLFMTNRSISRNIEILVVEDNQAEIRLMKEYFKDERMVRHNLHIVNDGAEAIKFLRKEGIYKDIPEPDIILLDLYMPKMDGDQVLQIIKTDNELKD